MEDGVKFKKFKKHLFFFLFYVIIKNESFFVMLCVFLSLYIIQQPY